MLKPLNYFKQIQCPQIQSCDRPYCLFKHNPLAPIPSASIVSYSTSNESSTLNIDNNLLPCAIQNLANAFQTVQNLMGENDPNFLTKKLTEIITQATACAKNESSQVLKCTKVSKQKSKLPTSVPEYNPTPISELNKSKSDESFEETLEVVSNEEIQMKKRKLNENDVEIIKKPKETSENDVLKNHLNKKADLVLKRMQNPSYFEAASSMVTSNSMKIDKLSLQQQLAKRYEIMNKEKSSQIKSTTPSGGTSSIASTNTQTLTQPKLIMDNTCKVSLILRQRYLKFIFEEIKNQTESVQKACDLASEHEKSIYDRAKTKAVYCNLAVNLIKTLRVQNTNVSTTKQSLNASSTNKSTTSLVNKTQINGSKTLVNKQIVTKPSVITASKSIISHEQMLNGVKSTKISYSINRKKALTIKDLTHEQIYAYFKKYILTEKQLRENCFPYESDENPHSALIPSKPSSNSTTTSTHQQASKYSLQNQSNSKEIKKCKRCTKNFTISKDYEYVSIDECIHHWGKLRTIRVNKCPEQKYACCNGDTKSDGCQVGKHVYDGDDLEPMIPVAGFVNTKNSTLSVSPQASNIYALDCEMCYTTKGLELTRVSVIDLNLKVVYESLVKPDYEIVDYNTRWSGITHEDLKNCKKKLVQVQQDLFKIINKNTILVGHSLDSDFKALKLIHSTVVDTSVVFPHRMGLPMKRALKNLTRECLQKIIQEDTDGHDSKEDACACMELMLWKVQQDIKN